MVGAPLFESEAERNVNRVHQPPTTKSPYY
uniref:Uncharacterized protein n=1 Tax=Schistosoma japonicum TaxID=6182 RepID=Q5C3K4_SCHJA|nr:unknown [Schistosoma japonicum]